MGIMDRLKNPRLLELMLAGSLVGGVAGEMIGTIVATGGTYLATTHFIKPVYKNR